MGFYAVGCRLSPECKTPVWSIHIELDGYQYYCMTMEFTHPAEAGTAIEGFHHLFVGTGLVISRSSSSSTQGLSNFCRVPTRGGTGDTSSHLLDAQLPHSFLRGSVLLWALLLLTTTAPLLLLLRTAVHVLRMLCLLFGCHHCVCRPTSWNGCVNHPPKVAA